MYDEIPTPAVVVELDQVTANVREMAKEARSEERRVGKECT